MAKIKIETSNRAYMSEKVFDKLGGRYCTKELKTKTTEFGTLNTETFGILYAKSETGFMEYMPCIISYGVCPRKQGLHITEDMADNREVWLLCLEFDVKLVSEEPEEPEEPEETEETEETEGSEE